MSVIARIAQRVALERAATSGGERLASLPLAFLAETSSLARRGRSASRSSLPSPAFPGELRVIASGDSAQFARIAHRVAIGRYL